jgi:F-type H+-transporting ATPase subunit epsilon
MRLTIVTPTSVVAEVEPVRHVRAEDPTGWLGILPGHADFLTVLVISVLVYRDVEGAERFVAVRGGVLAVSGRERVQVFAREAVTGSDLEALERDVLARFRRTAAAEEVGAQGLARLTGALLRRMADYLRLEPRATPRSMVPP